MSVFARLKTLFRKPISPVQASIYHLDAAQFRTRHAAYLAQKAAAIVQEPKSLAEYYGDFHPFLYRPDFDWFLKTEVLPLWPHTQRMADVFDTNHWVEQAPV